VCVRVGADVLLGANGAGTDVLPGIPDEARQRLDTLRTARERDAWLRLERGVRDEQARSKLLGQLGEFGIASQALRVEMIKQFSELVTDISALPAAAQPPGWNGGAARVAFAGTTLALDELWKHRASPDGTEAMEAVDLHLLALFQALGLAPPAAQQTSEALLERLAEQAADDILRVLDAEAARLGPEVTRAAPAGVTRTTFGWPDVGEDEKPGRRYTEAEYEADGRRSEEELAGIQAGLDEATSSWFTRMRLAAMRKINSRDKDDRPWLIAKARDVIIGFAVMALAGAAIYGIGRVATRGIFEARDEIKQHFERTGVALLDASANVGEAQTRIGSVREMLGAGIERMKRAVPLWADGKDIPPTVAGLGIVGDALAQQQAVLVEKLRLETPGATEAFLRTSAAELNPIVTQFAALRENFGKVPLSAFHGKWTTMLGKLRALDAWKRATAGQAFTLEEIVHMQASLGAANAHLAKTQHSLSDLVAANLSASTKFQTLSNMEDVFRTKSPVAAWIAHKIGKSVGSQFAGNAIWQTTATAQWFQHVEAIVNISFQGLGEIFTNGFGGFFAATTWGYLFRLFHSLAVALQLGTTAVSYFLRLSAWATAGLTRVSTLLNGCADVSDALADKLGTTASVFALAQGPFVHVGALVSIVGSMARIFAVMWSFGVAYVLGTAFVVGAAVVLLYVRNGKSPTHAVGYLGRVLLNYGWLIQPALLALSYYLQYRAYGVTALADEASDAPGLHPMSADAIKTLADVGARKRELVALAAQVQENNSKIDTLVHAATADALYEKNKSFIAQAQAGVFGAREVGPL
jgi:hypothetical protein